MLVALPKPDRSSIFLVELAEREFIPGGVPVGGALARCRVVDRVVLEKERLSLRLQHEVDRGRHALTLDLELQVDVVGSHLVAGSVGNRPVHVEPRLAQLVQPEYSHIHARLVVRSAEAGGKLDYADVNIGVEVEGMLLTHRLDHLCKELRHIFVPGGGVCYVVPAVCLYPGLGSEVGKRLRVVRRSADPATAAA